MSRSFKLFRLQQIDSQLDQGRSRLREIEAALRDNASLNEANRQTEKLGATLEAARKDLHRADEIVQNQRIKIEQTESTLYGGKVRNPKELQDLQNESAALKRYMDTLEERQLEALISFEEAEAAHQAAVSNQARVRGEVEQANSHLVAEQSSLSQEMSRLEGEREAVAGPIPPEDYSQYEKLRAQRRGVAVAKLNHNLCSACGSSLNAALLQAARSPTQLTRCESCGRILYAG